MILVDTSIWIDHIRKLDERLTHLLINGQVVMHDFIIGELALGHMKPRNQVLGRLAKLPKVFVASSSEVLTLIEAEGLQGSGVGYVDAHLLASSKLTPGVAIWTRDKLLRQAVEKLGVGLKES